MTFWALACNSDHVAVKPETSFCSFWTAGSLTTLTRRDKRHKLQDAIIFLVFSVTLVDLVSWCWNKLCGQADKWFEKLDSLWSGFYTINHYSSPGIILLTEVHSIFITCLLNLCSPLCHHMKSGNKNVLSFLGKWSYQVSAILEVNSNFTVILLQRCMRRIMVWTKTYTKAETGLFQWEITCSHPADEQRTSENTLGRTDECEAS